MLKKLILTAVGLGLVLLAFRIFSPFPTLKDGDLIFQTSQSSQSKAIGLASGSLYTHMGIVKKSADGWVVIEAVGPVKETPLKAWIRRGFWQRYSVYRVQNISNAQISSVLNDAKAFYGRPYDLYFSFDNKAIYCSELPHLAYAKSGIILGQRQSIRSLSHNIGPAKKLMFMNVLMLFWTANWSHP